MIIVVKGSFDRDTDKIRSKELRLALDEKITQLETAKDTSHKQVLNSYAITPTTTVFR